MDIERKEEIEDIIADVADAALEEEKAVEQIMAMMEEYADEIFVSRLEKGGHDTD